MHYLTLALAALSSASTAAERPATFGACAVCHKVAKGAPNGLGPNLRGVGGGPAAQVPGFNYSPAMKKSAIVWTRAELIAFIAKPQKRVPGTRMAYAGQPDPKQAALIADYVLGLR